MKKLFNAEQAKLDGPKAPRIIFPNFNLVRILRNSAYKGCLKDTQSIYYVALML
jgi:hypothetical protein